MLSVFLSVAVAVYLFVTKAVQPVIRTVSQETIRAVTVETVNLAVAEVMENNPTYIHLTKVEKDGDGNIVMISIDSATTNALARKVTEKAQRDLEKVAEKGINIPLGSLSGLSFFSGRGPNVNIKAIPVGNIETTFSSQFVAAGINQTLHKIFINVMASVNIVIPGAKNKVTTVTPILISETVIIGKVPQVYLGASALDPAYDLVP